jgi:hypothetical protein
MTQTYIPSPCNSSFEEPSKITPVVSFVSLYPKKPYFLESTHLRTHSPTPTQHDLRPDLKINKVTMK